MIKIIKKATFLIAHFSFLIYFRTFASAYK